MIPLDDPTLETIKQGQEDQNVPEEWYFYSYDIPWLNKMHYMKADEELEEMLIWRLHNTQHNSEEVEIRNGAMKTVIE
jgi:hypothetical protein